MKESVFLNKERNVKLTAFTITEHKKPTFLLLPGGSYTTCELSEVKHAAELFNSEGFNCFALQYSVGKHYKWPYPLDDYNSAVEYLTENAQLYGIDPEMIVVIGFSAGGHLAAMAASQPENRPYAAVICYGATNASTICYNAPGAPDANEAVNENTCPCFIAASRNDWIVPIDNVMNFMTALNKHFIDYEAHIYGYSMHGFNVGEAANAVPPLFNTHCGYWVKDFLAWLDELTTGKYVTIRECSEFNDKNSETYTTANSCKVIFDNKKISGELMRKFPLQFLIYKITNKKIGDFTDGISFRNLLEFTKVRGATIEKIDRLMAQYRR